MIKFKILPSLVDSSLLYTDEEHVEFALELLELMYDLTDLLLLLIEK